ncbi:MAG: hypothetical protein GEU80_08955 [Dehalococcoidia bacterium]|nr:hypothetical protein [Dehalococcoidia bacterium]
MTATSGGQGRLLRPLCPDHRRPRPLPHQFRQFGRVWPHPFRFGTRRPMNKMKTLYESGGIIHMNADAVREPRAGDDPRRLRLAVISDIAAPLPALDAVDVRVVEPADVLDDTVSPAADIVVLDTRGHDRLSMAVQVARGGTPVVVLGDARDADEQLRYLDAGADEYICYAGPAELAARLRSLLRRHPVTPEAAEGAEPDCQGAGVTISLERHEVRREGRLVHLTPAEFRLLAVLARYAGQVVPYYRLVGEVWGGDHAESRAHLRVHIRHLRQKLERDPDDPGLILTERGRG